jgi:hypothetical protein
MSAIRRTNNKEEVRLAKALWHKEMKPLQIVTV